MNEIQESNSLFHDVWGMYARGAGGEVIEQPGFLATWDDLVDTLKRINDFAATKQQPGMLIACDDWLPDGKEQFAEHGWIQISQAYGMGAENGTPDASDRDLEYRQVD